MSKRPRQEVADFAQFLSKTTPFRVDFLIEPIDAARGADKLDE
ncbi:hypothetical protein DSM3645_01475 [Blastopirellula marina DSM 3645]|uniref:Uncharacterized protein n=1 Tax=Blastopirellula marina DSM 3645 TaxID=314230 RepID=A3ZN14_9BACT|nr:hypothetical protein DSM3645_01475 [Blastopirellula marina DSM 3645]